MEGRGRIQAAACQQGMVNMKVEIRPSNILQAPGCYRTRYFVDVTFPGDNNIYEGGNYDSYSKALNRKLEIYLADGAMFKRRKTLT